MIGKIDLTNDTFRYQDKGFTSIINQIIELCYFHYQKYKNFHIHVSDYWCEKFYDLPKKEISEDYYDVAPLWLEDFFKKGGQDLIYNAHKINDYENLKIRNFIFNNVFSLKNNISIPDKRYELGIHIRGTDKKNELPIIQCNRVIFLLEEYLNKNNHITEVYIATDEKKYITCLKDYFKNINFYYYFDNFISEDGIALHHGHYDKNIAFFQVLKDSYTLKNCKNIFYCYSNVSLFSLMLGCDNHDQKILINDRQ